MTEKKTFPFIFEYEQTRILAVRTEQIANGCSALVKPYPYETPFQIAVREYLEKKIPLKIKRPLPDGTVEEWDLKDLEIIHDIKY